VIQLFNYFGLTLMRLSFKMHLYNFRRLTRPVQYRVGLGRRRKTQVIFSVLFATDASWYSEHPYIYIRIPYTHSHPPHTRQDSFLFGYKSLFCFQSEWCGKKIKIYTIIHGRLYTILYICACSNSEVWQFFLES